MSGKQDSDYVAPKDKADRLAEQYENTHQAKSGGGHDKPTPTGQSKPHSVRTD